MLHNLDDLLAIFLLSTTLSDPPTQYKGDFSQICSDLAFQIKQEKNADGYCVRFLCIEIDTEEIEASLPHDKNKKGMALVNPTCAQHSVTHRRLEKTVGFLLFASTMVPASCHFHC